MRNVALCRSDGLLVGRRDRLVRADVVVFVGADQSADEAATNQSLKRELVVALPVVAVRRELARGAEAVEHALLCRRGPVVF